MSHKTPEERPLSAVEHDILKQVKIDYWWSEQLDAIELASLDCRVEDALRVLILDSPEQHESDFEELSWQIGHDYMLGPDEIMEVFDIAEDKILRELA